MGRYFLDIQYYYLAGSGLSLVSVNDKVLGTTITEIKEIPWRFQFCLQTTAVGGMVAKKKCKDRKKKK